MHFMSEPEELMKAIQTEGRGVEFHWKGKIQRAAQTPDDAIKIPADGRLMVYSWPPNAL